MDNKDLSIIYKNISALDLSEDQLEQCSRLFSENYGNYSDRSAIRPGQNVKMPVAYYQRNYVNDNFSVALALLDNVIIGQAFYIRKNYPDFGTMTWIVQLVVNKEYRKQGIASKLLKSIWGFSNDYAWGLATANPCTVKTLESATMRKCNPSIIEKHIREISLIGKDIGFVEDGALEVSDNSSQINSHFDVDNSSFEGKEEFEERLGVLKPGREWLAFTFRDQVIEDEIYKKNFERLIEFSEQQLKEAYSRMQIKNHAWAGGEKEEIDFVLAKASMLKNTIKDIIDFGCGTGRHSIELASRGYDVFGIDFSQNHILQAKKQQEKESIISCEFIQADIREYEAEKKYDLALCLYDVVGSFPDEQNNERILHTVYDSLKTGGVLALSVMNFDLTWNLVPSSQKGYVRNDSDLLLKLKPTSIMQTTGDIFDPDYMIIDEEDKLVYRKEQFTDDGELSAEYVIRDKRYTMDEISELLTGCGFEIAEKRYVRAGHFSERLDAVDKHAKEILIISRRI